MPPAPPKTVRPLNLSKILTVRNEFWTAMAVWNRKNGVWSCAMADRPVQWMIGKTPGQVQIELLKLGANWSWDGPPQIGMDAVAGADHSGHNPSPLGTAIPPHRTGLPNTSQEWKPDHSALVMDQSN